MRFELSPLPYPKNALEPVISARTVDIHYEKHHKGYLDKLEQAIGDRPVARGGLEGVIRDAEGSVFNLAAQVWNHAFYWHCMTPNGGGKPSGRLADAIDRDFGGADDFRRAFAEAANGEFGSGWAWLVARPDGGLRVISTTDAENPVRSKLTPLLTLDVWEHAYYLDYQNERDRYVRGFVDRLIDWRFAEKNYEGVVSDDSP
jgi:Fe-Mn family superoxide dismutase